MLTHTAAPLELADETDTDRLTASVAQALASVSGGEHSVWALEGDLGAGKTTWVRHLLRHLGVQGRIKSPTYAVVEPHTCPPQAAWPDGLDALHFDFYRFNDPNEWEDAGFRELFAGPGIKLVEWPQKAADHLPPLDVMVRLHAPNADTPEVRHAALQALTPLGDALVQTTLAYHVAHMAHVKHSGIPPA